MNNKELVLDFISHANNCLPWHLSRLQNMRVAAVTSTAPFGIMQLASSIKDFAKTVFTCNQFGSRSDFAKQLLQTSVKVSTNAIYVGVLLDYFGAFPYQKEYRVALDSLYLLSSAFGSLKTVKEGTERFVSCCRDQNLNSQEKITKCISAISLIALGGWCLSQITSQAANLYQGSILFDSLTDNDKAGVLKNRAIHQLPKPKTSNAVIIDGVSPEWGSNFVADNSPFPFCELTYEHANTRFYRVNSTDSFCNALEDATAAFGKKIESLEILGHGLNEMGENSNQFIQLNKNYFFNGTEKEMGCIQKQMQENSQLFLLSCNSATKTETHPISLAERISKFLTFIKVRGVASFLNGSYISTWFSSNNTFHLQSHFFADMNGDTVFPQNIVTYE